MEIDIDYEGPVAPHRQLADWLRNRIISGEFPPNRALPSYARLGQMSGLSRDTIRKAIRSLTDEELVVVVAGQGVFVLEQEKE